MDTSMIPICIGCYANSAQLHTKYCGTVMRAFSLLLTLIVLYVVHVTESLNDVEFQEPQSNNINAALDIFSLVDKVYVLLPLFFLLPPSSLPSVILPPHVPPFVQKCSICHMQCFNTHFHWSIFLLR
ncbi:hypothetical protein EMCRGX_G006367 [Ephydatia muelleri]